jgi:hypothetical protein
MMLCSIPLNFLYFVRVILSYLFLFLACYFPTFAADVANLTQELQLKLQVKELQHKVQVKELEHQHEVQVMQVKKLQHEAQVKELERTIVRRIHTTTRLLEQPERTRAKFFEDAEIVRFWLPLDSKKNTRWAQKKIWESLKELYPDKKELAHIQPLFSEGGSLYDAFPKSSPWDFVDTHGESVLGFTHDATFFLKGQTGSALAVGSIIEFTGQEEAVSDYPSPRHKAKFVRDLLRIRSKAGNNREVHGCVTDMSRLVAMKLTDVENGEPILQRTAVVTGDMVREYMTAFASATPESVGCSFSAYRVTTLEGNVLQLCPQACLGKGAHGRVYSTILDAKKRDEKPNHFLKVFGDTASQEREASALKRLNEQCDSLHVPRLVAEGDNIIVASPCGSDINDVSDSHDLLELCAGLCDGLKSIHQAGLVHRDIRPSNIVVVSCDAGLKAVLIDWAASRQFNGDKEYKGTFEGTVHYAAASVLGELADDKSTETVVSPATDLESLVYTAYVLTHYRRDIIVRPLLVPSDEPKISNLWQQEFKDCPCWHRRLLLARSCDYDKLKNEFTDH